MPENEGPVVVDETRGDNGRNRDPELDQLMKYLSELSETIIAETDEDAKQTLIDEYCTVCRVACHSLTLRVETCIQELGPHIKGLVKWRKLSFVVERLIQDAKFNAIASFLDSISGAEEELFGELCNGEHSYFVIRAALRKFVALCADINSSENEELKKCAKSMKPLTKLFAEDIIKKLRNKYSSLLFRDLIQAHCGVLIASEKTPDGMPEIECRVKELSKSNRKQFGEICAAILAVENLPDLATCEKASPALGEMLVVVKESREDWIAEIVNHFTPSKEVVNSYLKSAAASHFLERLIYAMNEELLKEFYNNWMRGRLEELVLHLNGNFVLQRVITHSSLALFKLIMNQLNALGSLKQAWINGKGGIIARIVSKCGSMEEEKQIEMMKTLQIAVNSSDNFVEDLLIENKYGEMKVNYQGSIIAQAVMEYKGRARKILIDGLVKIEADKLKAIFDSSAGSYLLESMSNNIPDKKFCEMLRSLPISDIAFGRFGSRAVESIWKKKNMKVTQVLCECLADVHAELGQSQFGRHVNAKLRVTEFVRNKDRWMQNQNNQNQGNDKAGSKQERYAEPMRKKKKFGN